MGTNGLFGFTVQLVSKVLDFRWDKHNLLTTNIAHKDTPGYRPVDLSFEAELKKVAGSAKSLPLRTTNASHMGGKGMGVKNLKAEVISSAPTPPDGSSAVDIEKEMVKMAENQLVYLGLVQALSRKLTGIKDAIREAR